MARKVLPIIVFAFAALGASSLFAKNRFYIDDRTIDHAAGVPEVTIPDKVDNDEDCVGFSIAILYDPTKLMVSAVDLAGTAAADHDWSSGEIIQGQGKLHWGVVIDLNAPITTVIPAGTGHVFANLKAYILATAPGTTEVEPKDGLGEPPGGWRNVMSSTGEPVVAPVLEGGTITFVDSEPTEIRFKRCDPNGDGKSDMADAIWIVSALFRSGPMPACLESADCNDDGTINLSDALYGINHQFLHGPPPPAPFWTCGKDTATPDSLGCASSPGCP